MVESRLRIAQKSRLSKVALMLVMCNAESIVYIEEGAAALVNPKSNNKVYVVEPSGGKIHLVGFTSALGHQAGR